MAFEAIQSSNIKGFDYDEKAQRLLVTFHTGKTYSYDGVLPNVISEWSKVPSRGRFFAEHIKNNYKAKMLE